MYDKLKQKKKQKNSLMDGCPNKYSKYVLPLLQHSAFFFGFIIPPSDLLFQKQLWTGSQDIMKYFQTPTKCRFFKLIYQYDCILKSPKFGPTDTLMKTTSTDLTHTHHSP